MNMLKTIILILVIVALFLFIGRAIGGNGGIVIALILSLLMSGISYWFSDKIVLAMYGAKQVSERDAPVLYRLVTKLSKSAELPMPKVYVIPVDAPNAFATGRNPSHAAVAVTQGIMRLLDEDELEGVLAHEISHVGNRDILIGTIVATIAGAIMILSRMAQFAAIFGGSRDDRNNSGGAVGMIVLAIIAPIAAMIIQMAVSRTREYVADERGAYISRKPMALANALRNLEAGTKMIPMEANPTTAHMFIVNPLRGGGLLSIFSTHPPVEKRIERLEVIARKMNS